MHPLLDVLLVNIVNGLGLGSGKRGLLVNGKIGAQLILAGGTGNDAAHLLVLQNPLQGYSSQIASVGQSLPKRSYRLQAQIVIDARKGFPLIKSFSLAIEVAVIAGIKLRIGTELPGQETAGQGHTHNNADLTTLRLL